MSTSEFVVLNVNKLHAVALERLLSLDTLARYARLYVAEVGSEHGLRTDLPMDQHVLMRLAQDAYEPILRDSRCTVLPNRQMSACCLDLVELLGDCQREK